MTKKKYNFKTRANFELLRYCASTFKKGWLAMNKNGSWVACIRKPKWYLIGVWATGKIDDWHIVKFTRLPKRPAGFAQHSLIRVTGKGLAWFDENPDFVISSDGEYYD